jgi:hypothetical protein
LGKHPEEWSWSGWAHYAKGEAGLIGIDSIEEEAEGKSRKQEERKDKPAL